MAPESLELLLSSKPLASIFCRVLTTQGFSNDLCLHTQSIFLQLLGLYIKLPTANPSILSIYSTEHNKLHKCKEHASPSTPENTEIWILGRGDGRVPTGVIQYLKRAPTFNGIPTFLVQPLPCLSFDRYWNDFLLLPFSLSRLPDHTAAMNKGCVLGLES